MGSVQQIKVKWNNHQANFPKVFDNLLHKKEFVDVTLACEGQSLKAHKVVLSACSPYFHTLFVENPCQHPIVIMRDFKYCEIESVVEYMYKGEVNISRDSLREFLRTAQSLQVKGLADDDSGDTNNDSVETEDRSYTVPQSRVPDPEPEIRPSSRVSRPAVIEQMNISHDTVYTHSQSSPAVSREHFSQSNVAKRDSFSHSAPKRMRVSEKPTPLPPPPPVVDNTPSPSSLSYQSLPEISQTNSIESASEVIETPIKIEVKPFDVVGFETTQDSMLDESQDNDQGVEDSEPDMIDLGDDPEIIEDEPDIMFAHDNSQEGSLIQGDNLTSSLISALRDAGAGPSSGSPQQPSGEGWRFNAGTNRKVRTSKVWNYFQESDPLEPRVLCLECGAWVPRNRSKNRSGSYSLSTGKLIQHLLYKHPHLHNELKRKYINS